MPTILHLICSQTHRIYQISKMICRSYCMFTDFEFTNSHNFRQICCDLKNFHYFLSYPKKTMQRFLSLFFKFLFHTKQFCLFQVDIFYCYWKDICYGMTQTNCSNTLNRSQKPICVMCIHCTIHTCQDAGRLQKQEIEPLQIHRRD